MKKWRIYERLVAYLTTDDYDNTYTIIPNARIEGYISGRKRQLDILVDYRYNADLNRRIIIDAKERKRPIDVKEVEAFEGLMKDVKSNRGIIVCSNGYTKAAKKRAQDHIAIKLLSDSEIENLNLESWDYCRNNKCDKGLILWDATPGIFVNGIVTVQAIGKCDECGHFHIWCWGCGNKYFLKREEEWRCSCKGYWFWLTSIEPEEDETGYKTKGNYLILVLLNGVYQVVDRRPL